MLTLYIQNHYYKEGKTVKNQIEVFYKKIKIFKSTPSGASGY